MSIKITESRGIPLQIRDDLIAYISQKHAHAPMRDIMAAVAGFLILGYITTKLEKKHFLEYMDKAWDLYKERIERPDPKIAKA